jgi:hypothetical protein
MKTYQDWEKSMEKIKLSSWTGTQSFDYSSFYPKEFDPNTSEKITFDAKKMIDNYISKLKVNHRNNRINDLLD